MNGIAWIDTSLRLPDDGQAVLVKTAHGAVEHRVTFRAEPKLRWESRHFISEFDLYKYWRPLPTERRRPRADAHAVSP